jgi:hypothetical protein
VAIDLLLLAATGAVRGLKAAVLVIGAHSSTWVMPVLAAAEVGTREHPLVKVHWRSPPNIGSTIRVSVLLPALSFGLVLFRRSVCLRQ